MQLKAYARVQSKPETSDEEDRMFVSLAYAYDKDLTEHVVLIRGHKLVKNSHWQLLFYSPL